MNDENSEADAPGPIASQDWFEGWLSVVLGYGEPSQWITAIGAFGYDWFAGVKKAEMISFGFASSSRVANSRPAKPPKTTE